MKKGLILICVITMLFTSIVYAGIVEEIIGKIETITQQRKQREPIEVELQGNKNIRSVYTTSTIKVKEKKPKKK